MIPLPGVGHTFAFGDQLRLRPGDVAARFLIEELYVARAVGFHGEIDVTGVHTNGGQRLQQVDGLAVLGPAVPVVGPILFGVGRQGPDVGQGVRCDPLHKGDEAAVGVRHGDDARGRIVHGGDALLALVDVQGVLAGHLVAHIGFYVLSVSAHDAVDGAAGQKVHIRLPARVRKGGILVPILLPRDLPQAQIGVLLLRQGARYADRAHQRDHQQQGQGQSQQTFHGVPPFLTRAVASRGLYTFLLYYGGKWLSSRPGGRVIFHMFPPVR